MKIKLNHLFFFTLETGIQTKKSKNRISISQNIFKNSVYFKQLNFLKIKFPLQLIIFKNKEKFNEFMKEPVNAILFKTKNFLFIDKNFFLLKLFNDTNCSNRLTRSLQEALQDIKNLLN